MHLLPWYDSGPGPMQIGLRVWLVTKHDRFPRDLMLGWSPRSAYGADAAALTT
jgi:hypothetical protein